MSRPGMGFWIQTACRFLRRSGRSTATLSSMIMIAVSALIFLASLAVGVNDAMIRNSVNLYSGHVTGFELPLGLDPEALSVEGAEGILKRLQVRGTFMSSRRFETATLVGIEPKKEILYASIHKKVTTGRYPRKGENAMLVGQLLSRHLQVRVGDTITFEPDQSGKPLALMVSGLYDTGIDHLDREVAFCPESLVSPYANTWTAAVFLKKGISPTAVTAKYDETFSGAYRFLSWETLMPDLRQLIDLQYLSMAIVIIVVFAVVSVGIACAFVIFILKNMREYGIMKAMGISSGEIMMLIGAKVVLMNVVASFMGVIIGISLVLFVDSIGGIDLGAFTSHNRYFTVSGMISPRLTPFSLWVPPAVSIGFGFLSTFWPALLVIRNRAAQILRMV